MGSIGQSEMGHGDIGGGMGTEEEAWGHGGTVGEMGHIPYIPKKQTKSVKTGRSARSTFSKTDSQQFSKRHLDLQRKLTFYDRFL